MKKQLFAFLLCLTCLPATARQWEWHNPMNAGFPVVQNQGFTKETGRTYTRLPERAKAVVREPVWNLSRNSAGLALHFYCNAPQIKIRYTVSGPLNMPHMPSTGVSGIDMYNIGKDGVANFCFGNYSFGDTIQYSFGDLSKANAHNEQPEYHLYLPLYNTVEWLEIGIPEEKDGKRFELTFIPASGEKPIVLYGTSIAQGACASRPGMAWGTIVQRTFGCPLVNLGFSGNGRLEKEVLDFINEQDAMLFILDCLPNLTTKSEAEVTDLVVAAVTRLRSKHTAPILLVEHAGYSNAPTDNQRYECYTRLNKGSRKGYEKLRAEGVKNLFYLTHEELNLAPDSWVDYVHPSDFGMTQQAAAITKKLQEIFKIQNTTK